MYACQSVVPGQVTGGPTAVEELARIREEATKGSSGETVRKCLWSYLEWDTIGSCVGGSVS